MIWIPRVPPSVEPDFRKLRGLRLAHWAVACFLLLFSAVLGPASAWALKAPIPDTSANSSYSDTSNVASANAASSNVALPNVALPNVATASATAPSATSSITPASQSLAPATNAAKTLPDGTLQLPDLNQPVIDEANALSPGDRDVLANRLRSIHQTGRAQIGMVLIPSTQGEAIFDYSRRAFEQWQLGDKERDNGLLFVVAVQDRKIQILTGYGLEGILPDVVVHRIIEEAITPAFKQGNYAAGLTAGVDRVDAILQQDPETARASAEQMQREASQGAHSGGLGILPIVVILLMVGVFLRLFLGRFLSALGLGAVGGVWAMMAGMGMGAAILVFILVLFLQLIGLGSLLNGLGRGGFGGGGFGGGGFGGGGYSGGGGSFGGGGASGSW